MLFQQIVNGLTLGGVYALIALGYTMVYGVLELINFAHGEIYMIGAYLGIIFFGLFTSYGLSTIPALILTFLFSIAFTSFYGFTVERVGYRPLRNAPRLSPFISAIGISIFLQNYVMLARGPRDQVFPDLFKAEGFTLLGAKITYLQGAIILVSLLLMTIVQYFVHKTKTGKAMRAVAEDRVMAGLVGIDANRIISATFVIGSGLAAVAGLMIAMYYGLVNYTIGYIAGIKAFVAAVLGGVGSVGGAIFGGLLLGVVESLGAAYISSEYKDAYAFILLIIVLLVRPTGIFGRSTNVKV